MDYSQESLRSRKYLTFEQACEVSGLTLPELRRAIALEFVRAVDVGNSSFIEHQSLLEYLQSKRAPDGHVHVRAVPSRFFPDERSLDEDNHTNQKEREVFQAALERDSKTASQLATAPYIAIALLVLFAFTMALPVTQTVQSEQMRTAQTFFANAHLKEVTTEKVSGLLERARVSQEKARERVEENIASAERRDYFAGYQEQQGANALSAWIESISGGVDALARSVYETIETTVQSLR